MNRRILLVATLSLLVACLSAADELVKFSRLKESRGTFHMNRDIFFGVPLDDSPSTAGTATTAAVSESAPDQATMTESQVQPDIADELYRSIQYTGYAIRNKRRTALLNISGEYILAFEGDTLLQRIKVVRIGTDAVSIEYEGKLYEIQLKGEGNG